MNFFKTAIISICLIITFLIVFIKPETHKLVVFYPDNNQVVNQEEKLDKEEAKLDWGKWHSDLMNKILNETRVPSDVELGTIITLQFNVSSDGTISNIQVRTEPEKFSSYVKKYYTDYINNLYKKSILAFPQGSKREIVTFKRNFKVANTTKLSKPTDFNDIETVK